MAEANTTQMETNPAPFKEEAVPTSTPQNQSSYSSQGWMNTKLGQTIVGSLSVLVLGSTLKGIHHCWMKTHPESQGVLSYFRSKCFSKPTEDLEQKDEKSYLPLLTITDNVLKNDDSAVAPIGENPTNVDTNTLEL
ncbi:MULTISPECIES: hypothetical protein [unclassified Candidatus Tisiphia]|uniref:hypothetical protein n=1 Tax=unclassified Candidatus Tisiphia TaxID=2996318 RepID=UPI00312C7EB7